MGQSGDDVISSWQGNDYIDGGADNDALWGGAGVDTINGGPDTDILYGGAGDGDLLIGGDGSGYYYWARTDGIDRIDDQDAVAGGESENYILVFSGYDGTGQMPAGSGVFETDQDLYDSVGGNDMVQLDDRRHGRGDHVSHDDPAGRRGGQLDRVRSDGDQRHRPMEQRCRRQHAGDHGLSGIPSTAATNINRRRPCVSGKKAGIAQ